jgi:hypothetical protein
MLYVCNVLKIGLAIDILKSKGHGDNPLAKVVFLFILPDL